MTTAHQSPSFSNSKPRGIQARAIAGLDATVFVLLLGLIVLTNIPYGTVDAWWEALFEGAVFLFTAIWIFEAVLRRVCAIRKLGVFLPIAILVAFAFSQAIVWPTPLASIASSHLTAEHTLTIDRYQ